MNSSHHSSLSIIIITLLTGFGSLLSVHLQGQDTLIAQYNVIQCNNLIVANADNPDFVILDVRTALEHNPKHIWGSINRNYSATNFADMLDVLPRHKLYLVHCKSGSRSTAAWNLMQQMSFAKVVNMLGGMNNWEAANYPVTSLFEPLLMAVSDTMHITDLVSVGDVDTISLTITNRANSSLTFASVSTLAGTEFSTNFNLSTTLAGAEDYSFSIYYEPQNLSSDTLDFLIESNGGNVTFNIRTLVAPPTEFTISLPAGWSGVSSYIVPANSDITSVFAPVTDELIILQNFDGIYWPDAGVNTIVNWNSSAGYMVKMESAQQLTFVGEMQSNRLVELNEGWNYLPVPGVCESNTTDLFSSILDKIKIVKEIAGSKVFWPEHGISTLDKIVPGKAYFVLVEENVTVEFSECP